MHFYAALAVAVFVPFFRPSLCQDSDEEALQNTGDCPRLTWHHHCSFPIVHECAVDVDCGETENKCCFNGCKLTCQTAVKHKHGKRHQGHTMCEKPMDLVFMIDSSESVGVENFKKIKKMVDRTLTQFTISEKKTHVSIIMIDSVPHIELNLNTLKGANLTSENVLKVVDNLQFISGQTRIDLALRMARKEVFSKLGGGRKHVQKILLVFSDGGQTWNPTMLDLRNEVEDLMMVGVQIYSVGVWAEELNLSNLLDIASSPNNFFAAEFYRDLLAQLKKISKGTNYASQTEILAEFQDITGYGDTEKCRTVLEQHNWDIETAVQDTLNEAEGAQPVFHPWENSFEASDEDEVDNNVNGMAVTRNQVPTTATSTTTTAAARTTTTTTVAQRQNEGWLVWFLSIPLLPFRFGTSIVRDLVGFIVRLIWPRAFEAETTPLEDVLRFKTEFEAEYGTVHPTFYQGSYSQALNDAKRELRFLLVYLHSSEHEDTEEFCRSTMTNDGFREYVNGNMLFWGANVKSQEGYKVSRALREATYPFLALICLRDNRMTVVGRMEGLMNVDGYVSLLARLIEDNEPALVAARVDRQERTQAQQLRDEQDEAYYESVRADQEKERKKREEEDKKRQEEENKRKKEEARQNRAESIARERVDRKLRVPEEPESSHPNAIRVLMKLSNGKRLERRFLKSHPLQALYDFVFCDEESPAEFVLVSNFPRKVYALDSSSEDQTLEDAGIETNAMLFVQNVEDESDSD